MKMALFTAALLLGGTAIAQDGTQPAAAPEPAPEMQQPETLPPAEPAPQMQQPEAPPSAPPAGPTTVAPDNSAPQPDNSGTPVISNPAQAPAGFNQPPQVGGTGVPADARPTPQPATQNYPPCSRAVTDNCVQRERGRRPR